MDMGTTAVGMEGGEYSENVWYAIVVIHLPLSLPDEGEIVGVVTSVGGLVRPADVGNVDNLNCLDDCGMHT